MTYDQYWHDDPWLARFYKKADELRREREDALAWVQGLYFKSALDSTVMNVFMKKGAEPVEYPDEPFMRHSRNAEEEEERHAEKERLRLVAYLDKVRAERKAMENGGE